MPPERPPGTTASTTTGRARRRIPHRYGPSPLSSFFPSCHSPSLLFLLSVLLLLLYSLSSSVHPSSLPLFHSSIHPSIHPSTHQSSLSGKEGEGRDVLRSSHDAKIYLLLLINLIMMTLYNTKIAEDQTSKILAFPLSVATRPSQCCLTLTFHLTHCRPKNESGLAIIGF